MMLTGSLGIFFLAWEVWISHEFERHQHNLLRLARIKSLHDDGKLREFVVEGMKVNGWGASAAKAIVDAFDDVLVERVAAAMAEDYRLLGQAEESLRNGGAGVLRIRRWRLILGAGLLLVSTWSNALY